MNIFKTIKEKASYLIVSAALVVGVFTPVLVSAVVSAAQVSSRSIALSSSSADAANVTYEVKFTVPSGSATEGAFGIIFCSNSPDPATTCTAPGGLSTSATTSATTNFTAVTHPSANVVVVAGPINASDNITVDIDGMHNPTLAGPLYARIATYADATTAAADTTGTAGVDTGGVAMSIANTIGVSGAVLESMTFCVSGAAIGQDCGVTSGATPTSPLLTLGETVGSTKALEPTAISTGTLYTQISTNAATGAVINLKSGTDCGGLKRIGASVCDIAPALQAGITPGIAAFGVRTGTAAGTAGDAQANGTLEPVSGSGYNPTTYALNYLANNSTGVTSAIGDPFLDTNSKPVNNQNMDLTFGATVSNNTPAGNYTTSLSLIATGKF